MRKIAKEFESDSFSSFSGASSFKKVNKSNIPSDYNPDFIKMQISDENEEVENNKENDFKEDIINENNSQEEFNILDQNNIRNNNINNNYMNQENDEKNLTNIQNIGTQI